VSRSSATEKGGGDDARTAEVRHDDLIVSQPAPERLLHVTDQVKNVDRIDEPAFEERRVGVDADPVLLEQPAPDEIEERLDFGIRHTVPTWSSSNTRPRDRSTHGCVAGDQRR